MTHTAETIIFGGAFNPPTLAHEEIVRRCLRLPNVDEVWVMPSSVRRDKTSMVQHAARLSMLAVMKQYSFGNDPRLKISDFEQQLPTPTQTISTVAALREAYPDRYFRFVFGGDSYQTMPSWSGGEILRQELPMLLVARLGTDLPPQSERLQHLELSGSVQCLSSTQLREARLRGGDISRFTSYAVAKYIMAHNYYELTEVAA